MPTSTNYAKYSGLGGSGGGGGSGVTTIGTIDSQSPSPDGAVISGADLYMQSASASSPGLANTTAQTFAGLKTFSNDLISPVVIGSASASGTLTLESTSNATKGEILFGIAGGSAFDEVNNRLGVGTASPTRNLTINDPSGNTYLSFMANGAETSLFGTDSGRPFIYFNLALSQYGLVQNSSGQWSIGHTAPAGSAWLTLQAGLAAAGSAPLKLLPGTNLTTPEEGAIEFDGTNFYGTNSTPARAQLLSMPGIGLTNSYVSEYFGATTPQLFVDPTIVNPTNQDFIIGGLDTTTDLMTNNIDIISGNLTFVGSTNSSGTISVVTGNIDSQSAMSSSQSGDLYFQSGSVAGDNSGASNSGDIDLFTGSVTNGSGNSGRIYGYTGDIGGSGSSGGVNFFSGQITAGNSNSGNLTLTSGNNVTSGGTGSSGEVTLVSGGVTSNGNSGEIELSTGSAVSGNTGEIALVTGPSTSGNSGNIVFQIGTFGATSGYILLDGPPVLQSTPQTITAGQTIISSTGVNAIQAAGAVSTSTSTVIAAGIFDGQILTVVNVGSHTITLKAGGNTDLPGLTDYPLASSGSISFVYIGTTWYCTGASVN